MSPAAEERLRHLQAFLASRPDLAWVDRAIVLDECGSTQDEAFAAAAGKPGLILTALRQTAGRGRLGRIWSQDSDLGLAVTFVLDAGAFDAASLPLRIACAICDACEKLTGLAPADADSIPTFRIKWPNDVVVSRELHQRHAPQRKLAGVLIERRDNLLLIGIGINTLQQDADFPAALRGKAISLAMLIGGDTNQPRHDWLLRHLIESLNHFLYADRREVRQSFRTRDVLTGTRRTFEHDRARFTGEVISIDPIDGITLAVDRGEKVTLPAMSTTLIPD